MKLLAIILGAVLLAVAATAQPVFVSVCNFDSTNGSFPLGRLTLGNDGSLYGTAKQGGVNGDGTVFRLAANGTATALASFGSASGLFPVAGLTLGNDGNFYGTASAGGSAGDGTIIQFKTNGTLTQLTSFTGSNGKSPQADLTLGRDGNFYSLTSLGTGTSSFGTVFRVSTNGTLATLSSFTNGNGAYPNSALTQGIDGAFYGVTPDGGRTNLNSGSGYGTVFKVTTNGVLTPLIYFSNTNGYYPAGALTLGNDGCFYGTTEFGGSNNLGTVFKITTNGTLTVLASFAGTNGNYPVGALLSGYDGSFYGVTYQGGSGGYGTVFRVTTNGDVSTLVNFANTNGAYPKTGLVVGGDGNYYGTTYFGGNLSLNSGSGYGTIYKLVLPATSPLWITNPMVANRVFSATVTGSASTSIQIQYTTNLPPAWNTLTNLVFTTGSAQFTDTTTNSHRFYRAVQ